jgi:UDP-N-acetylglucosamine--dolichyl-phosphate N-acetylglucosaminephosphotransferase
MYGTYLTILIPSVITFVLTFFSTRFLMSYLFGAGIVAEDHNKARIVKLAGSGGVAVAFGIISGILIYTFGGSFVFVPLKGIVNQLLAVALSIVLIAFVGFLDDVNVMRQRVMSTGRMDIRKGLKQWQKPLLTFIGALPLMAISAGVHSINIPFIGPVFLGIVYPLLVLPLAIIFVSNSFNLLGGFDGLQPSMAIIASAGLLIYSLAFGAYIGVLLSALLLAALLSFLLFNMYPAKIIPGDSFTYTVGASLVAIMVMGSAEAFGVVIFLPWIIEFLLHLRKRFKVSDLGIRQRDGTFKPPYGGKIYSLTHLVMNLKRANEREVTLYLSMLELAFVILAFVLKLSGVL